MDLKTFAAIIPGSKELPRKKLRSVKCDSLGMRARISSYLSIAYSIIGGPVLGAEPHNIIIPPCFQKVPQGAAYSGTAGCWCVPP
jgi:hypothetical protein